MTKKAIVYERKLRRWEEKPERPIEVYCPYCDNRARLIGTVYMCPSCRAYFFKGVK